MKVFNQAHHFCSWSCRNSGVRSGLASRPTNRISLVCEVCKSPYEDKMSHYLRFGSRFCSRKCQGIRKRIELKGANSPKYNQISFQCIICGKEFFRKSSKISKAKTCSNSCRYKLLSLVNSGKGNPSYTHGKSNEPYPLEFTKDFKNRIIIRDGEVCLTCGISRAKHKEKTGFDLHVHHIDFDKSNLIDSNLMSLCMSCHGKTQKRPTEYWIDYYTKVMKELYYE